MGTRDVLVGDRDDLLRFFGSCVATAGGQCIFGDMFIPGFAIGESEEGL